MYRFSLLWLPSLFLRFTQCFSKLLSSATNSTFFNFFSLFFYLFIVGPQMSSLPIRKKRYLHWLGGPYTRLMSVTRALHLTTARYSTALLRNQMGTRGSQDRYPSLLLFSRAQPTLISLTELLQKRGLTRHLTPRIKSHESALLTSTRCVQLCSGNVSGVDDRSICSSSTKSSGFRSSERSPVRDENEEMNKPYSEPVKSDTVSQDFSVPSSLSNPPLASFSTPSLANTVQRLISSFQKSEAVRREQGNHLATLQRHLMLMEQRLSTFELALEERENQLHEVLRETSDLHMEAVGVQQVVQQLEKRWELLGCAESTRNREKTIEETEENSIKPTVDAACTSATIVAESSCVSNNSLCRKEESQTIKKEIDGDVNAPAFLNEVLKRLTRLEEAAACVEQARNVAEASFLSSSSSPLEACIKVAATQEQSAAVSTAPPPAAAAAKGVLAAETSTNSAASSMTKGTTSSIIITAPSFSSLSCSRELVREQLIKEGVIPYRDLKTGIISVVNKTILVRGAPFFWGAAHIRELCESLVGGGGVVSCLLSRPLPSTQDMHSRSAGEGVTSCATPSDTASFPKPAERIFEVVFRHPSQAVKVLSSLHRIPVMTHPKHRGPIVPNKEKVFLSSEPVVSERIRRMIDHLRSTSSTARTSSASSPSFCSSIMSPSISSMSIVTTATSSPEQSPLPTESQLDSPGILRNFSASSPITATAGSTGMFPNPFRETTTSFEVEKVAGITPSCSVNNTSTKLAAPSCTSSEEHPTPLTDFHNAEVAAQESITTPQKSLKKKGKGINSKRTRQQKKKNAVVLPVQSPSYEA